MQKDELIQVHNLLCQLKRQLETAGVEPDRFQEYAALGVTPLHVHRSKTDHKRAIFVLGKELSNAIGSANLTEAQPGPGGRDFVRQRFEAFAARVR